MLQLQIVYPRVQRIMRENNIPRELIDIIFDIVHKYNFGQMIMERNTTVDSIWWRPSRRLQYLCRERGALQIGYYDMWTLFPSFILFSQVMAHQDPDIKAEFFDKKSCGVDRICKNCIFYGFPCRNKVCYCPMTERCWNDDDHIWATPNFEIESLWSIKAAPRTRDPRLHGLPAAIDDYYQVHWELET